MRAMLFEAHNALIASNALLLARLQTVEVRTYCTGCSATAVSFVHQGVCYHFFPFSRGLRKGSIEAEFWQAFAGDVRYVVDMLRAVLVACLTHRTCFDEIIVIVVVLHIKPFFLPNDISSTPRIRPDSTS